MTEIIVITKDELINIIEKTIETMLSRQGAETGNQEKPDTVTLDEAIVFLHNNGFVTSKGKLYKLTSSNQIPHRKFGNKLVFSREEILA